MRKKPREFIYHRDVVIVCEGSTTEYNYFCEIRDYVKKNIETPAYTNIRIIPGDTDDVVTSSDRPKKKMLPDSSQWRYYLMAEDNEGDYNQYKSQPVRYVREAELFLKKRGFDEAWAVYDWDEKPGQHQKKHSDVMPILDRNKDQLFVAFSSYSFEEWILAHFERNTFQFFESDCSDSSGRSYMCGSSKADSQNDCHGVKCIAGYLRTHGYVPMYSKKDKNLFLTYTLQGGKVNRKALENASWLRFKGSRFSSDAYTDVDFLVSKLMNDDYCCEWFSLGSPIKFLGTSLVIVFTDNHYEVKNVGRQSCRLTGSNFITTDIDGENESPVLESILYLEPEKILTVEKSKVNALLKFCSPNKDFFVEL